MITTFTCYIDKYHPKSSKHLHPGKFLNKMYDEIVILHDLTDLDQEIIEEQNHWIETCIVENITTFSNTFKMIFTG